MKNANAIVRSVRAVRVVRNVVAALGLCCVVVASAAAQAKPTPASAFPPAAKDSPLPGGASSLEEAHGDWRVACAHQENQKHCTLSQQIMDPASRQRLLGIEIAPQTGKPTEGTLVFPFGLALDKGVTMQVDDGAPGPTLRFRTCLPAGCVIVLTLDSATVTSFKSGRALVFKAVGDNAQNLAFSASLKGFAGAYDRTADLSR